MEPCVKAGDLATMQNQIKTLFKRQEKHEELLGAIQGLVTAVELVNQGQTTIQRDIEAIQDDVGELKDRPRNNWDSFVKSAISAIVGGLIVYIFFKLGLKL